MLRRPVESAQYTSLAFGRRCAEMGVRPSTGSVGDAYDNAMAESFFASLECELIERRAFRVSVRAARISAAYPSRLPLSGDVRAQGCFRSRAPVSLDNLDDAGLWRHGNVAYRLRVDRVARDLAIK